MPGEDRGFDENVEWLSIEEPVQPGPSPNRFIVPAIVSGAVLIGAFTLFVVVKQILRLNQPSVVSVSAHGLHSSPLLWTESSKVFSDFDACQDLLADLSSDEENERRAVMELMDAISKCSEEGDTDCFSELIDYERLMKRIDLTGRLLQFSAFEKRVLRSELKRSLEAKPIWARLEIVGILTPDDDPASRVVYAYGWSPGSEELSEVRILVAADETGWKAYDWVRCDLGLYESEEWSLYAFYANNPLMENFHEWARLVGEADALAVEGDLESAKAKIRQAETQSVPHEFDDYRWLLTGYRWQTLDEYREAERCFQKVSRPQKMPGAYFGLMNCNRNRDVHEAIKYAQKYEQTVGPTFELCSIKAQMYASIHQKDLATEQWRKTLRFQPNNETALWNVLLSLPSEEKSDFEFYLDRLDDPVETIASIAPIVGWQDYEGVQFLGQTLQRREPNAPATHYVQGLIADLDGEYRRAADHYRSAFEAETEQTLIEKYSNAYFESMSQIGEGVSAWKNLPNQKSTFESLVYYHDMEESDLSIREFREIAELYRQQFPNEPLGFRFLADVAVNERRYEDAEQLLRTGLERADALSDEQEGNPHSLNYSLVNVLYQLDRLEEAYNVPGDRNENFRQLCRLAIRKQQWDDVRTLLDWHRKLEPTDPMLNYYAAELAIQAKQWDEAIQELESGIENSETYERWMFKSQLENAYVESGRWAEYYASSNETKEVFDSLARRFVSDENWEALQRLIGEHQKRWRNDGQVLKHQANAAWQREEYADFISFAESLLESDEGDVVLSYERGAYEDRLLSAMLRRREFHRARELAQELHASNNNPAALAVVSAAQGDWHEAQTFALLAATVSENANRLYWNDDVGPDFLDPRFQVLHAEFPVELPYYIAPTSIVFHSDEPWQLQSDAVAEALSEIGEEGSVEISRLNTIRKDVSAAYSVSLDGAKAWIATGTGTWRPGWRLDEENKPIVDTAKNCQHWLAVGTAGWVQPQRDQAQDRVRAVALRLAERLTDDRPKAFSAKDDEAWEVFRVYPMQEEYLSTWETAGHMKSLTTEGVLWQDASRQELLERDREFKLGLRDAVRKLDTSPDARLEVLVCLLPEIGIGNVRVAVTSVKRRYTEPVLVGTLTTSCELIPELSKGLPVAVESSRVRAWRLNSDPTVLRPQ